MSVCVCAYVRRDSAMPPPPLYVLFPLVNVLVVPVHRSSEAEASPVSLIAGTEDGQIVFLDPPCKFQPSHRYHRVVLAGPARSGGPRRPGFALCARASAPFFHGEVWGQNVPGRHTLPTACYDIPVPATTPTATLVVCGCSCLSLSYVQYPTWYVRVC